MLDTLVGVKQLVKAVQLSASLGVAQLIDHRGDARLHRALSAGVLEHVDKDAVPAFVSEMYRILRPGGTALQSIDISDHLAHYDSSVSKKRYLSYSDRSWRLLFENKVQYINRIQRKEWMDLFRRAGFDVMEEDSRYVDIDNVEISSKYSRMSQADLGCTTLRVTFRKP